MQDTIDCNKINKIRGERMQTQFYFASHPIPTLFSFLNHTPPFLRLSSLHLAFFFSILHHTPPFMNHDTPFFLRLSSLHLSPFLFFHKHIPLFMVCLFFTKLSPLPCSNESSPSLHHFFQFSPVWWKLISIVYSYIMGIIFHLVLKKINKT